MFDIFTSLKDEVIEKMLSHRVDEMQESGIIEGQKTGEVIRKSKHSWIHHPSALQDAIYATNIIMRQEGWNMCLDYIEPLQYTEYYGDETAPGQYGWHQDSFRPRGDFAKKYDGRIRKVSFSIFLNDDYEGGQFDLENRSPEYKKRHKTFRKKGRNNIVFFPSWAWHRVRPVTKGTRKSIVGWVLGPP
jgi:PKHD-type hydroxylase|tara:strand:+ start:46 stop:609 length:564 start_codon:yes stop_codon:yes gene_type:complete